jgi:thermitase
MAHCHRQRQLSRLPVKLYEENASLRTSALTAALVAATLCLLSATVGRVQEEWTATPAGGPEYVGSPGAMIVRYSEGADKGAVRADIVQAVKGARPEEVLGTANAEVFAVEKPLEDAVRAAEALPGVKYAELDQSGFALFSPDDVYYVRGQQWGPKKINAEKAWDIARGDIGPGPDIGVLGTGYFHHPDLKDKVVSEYDCGSNDGRANPRGVHGTHVAGIAAAADNGLGVAGMAPEADLFVGQVLAPDGNLRVKNVVQCGDLAMKRGVKVINLSLGFDEDGPLRLLQEAVDRWNGHGINVVAAAGNHASPYGYPGHPIYPAAFDGVIGVAATTEANTRWPFSSAGYWVDVAAPGVAIVSTSFKGGDPAYDTFSGSSQAAPHVAGALACARANGKNRAEAQRDLFESAHDWGRAGRDDYFGYGALNMLGTVRR